MTRAGYLARDDLWLLRGVRTVENAGFDLAESALSRSQSPVTTYPTGKGRS